MNDWQASPCMAEAAPDPAGQPASTPRPGGARALYLSYTGLLDPLGQSQVLQYVLALAREHHMTLLTFEKPAALADRDELAAVAAQCRTADVDWHYLTYHNRPGIPATVYDIAVGTRKAVRLARAIDADIVHARSYIAGLMALGVKRATGARYIFDMRGFWPDERVDGGIWKSGSARYKLFKRVERQLFRNADHVVSLTRAGVREFAAFDYLAASPPPASVIPTCTNLELFRPLPAPPDKRPGFTLGYVGSAGSWYMFEEVAAAVRMLFERRPDAHFHVVNKGDHEAIRAILHSQGVDLSRVEVRAVPFSEVAHELAMIDAGIFFIKPVWSKRASSPTRHGEFLACGKPVLANAGVGDVAENITETGTGVAISNFDDASLGTALDRLVALAREPDISSRCRTAAEQRFSLEQGVATYSGIYRELAAMPGRASGRR